MPIDSASYAQDVEAPDPPGRPRVVCSAEVLLKPRVFAFIHSTVRGQETLFLLTFIRGSGGRRRDTVTGPPGRPRVVCSAKVL